MSDFVKVSQKTFYATVGQMNVHPRAEPAASYWETPNRVLVGITTPGWKCEGEKSYSVRTNLLTPTGAA
jgi:hypothetical protein